MASRGTSRDVYDAAVVGGGIVGLATALALVRAGSGQMLVLEAEETLASHQTGHNSGVIHSGLYYEPGSFKARTCVAGREATYRFCEEAGVPYRRCGKLVVATCPEEIGRLDELERRGRANGLQGLRRLSAGEVSEKAPGVVGIEGLWVAETGITDFATVARAIAARVVEEGGEIRTGARLVDVRRDGASLRLVTEAGDVAASALVNCAGLHSDRVARMCGLDPGLRIVPFRGDYFELDSPPEALLRWPIYPVPDPRLPFLGVHFTPDLAGRVEVGPNAALALGRHAYGRFHVDLADLTETLVFPGFWRLMRRHWRSAVTELLRSSSHRAFARAARRLVPGVEASSLRGGGSGVRAQAVAGDGTLVDDFRLARGERSVHVLNAPSPGATSALAIGEAVARTVLGEGLPAG